MTTALKSIPWWGWTLFALLVLYMLYNAGVFNGLKAGLSATAPK